MLKTKMLPGILRRVILCWLLGVLIEYILQLKNGIELSVAEGPGHMSLANVVAVGLFVFGVLSAINRSVSTAQVEKWGILTVFCSLSAVAVGTSFRSSFLGACGLLLTALLVYALRGWNEKEDKIPQGAKGTKGAFITMVLLSVLFFLFLCLWTVSRVYGFSAPTYDFGIFSQMFYYMKKVGRPLTTLERDGLLSHFAVHVSPIYYLLLPLYAIAPHPATLQVLQALILTSSVIPMWKIGKQYGLYGWARVLLCSILMLYPAFSGGVGYDFHENCFLTPLILWLFYGIEKKNTPLTFAAAILILAVKEDAPVYVAVIGLWLLLRVCLRKGERNQYKTAICLLAISILWFLGATAYLKIAGEGVMSGRYNNFMERKDGSLWSVICCVFVNPMKLLYECSDPEKLRYIALTMLPLLGFPLLTRRYERYLLLIPYVLVNLMSDYKYQHEIFYQYSFGSTAFLLYLTVINVADIRRAWGRTALLSAMTVLCGVAFSLVIVPKAMTYPMGWAQQRESIRQVRQVLSTIPEDAIITASTFYTVELSQREMIYDLGYASRNQLLGSEYVVMDPRRTHLRDKYATPGKDNGLQNLLVLLQRNGYERVAIVEECLYVYRKTEAP